MSVYTKVSSAELSDFLRHYEVGELLAHQGITAGIENTNYFVTTAGGEYVLTLFEATPPEDLPFFLDLMATLAEHGVPSAHPIANKSQRYLDTLNGKPATLVVRLTGDSVAKPNQTQCAAIGAALGRMHQITAAYQHYRENDRGLAWRKQTAATIRDLMASSDQHLLDQELDFQAQPHLEQLPCGVIHADLFHDNALFVADDLTGIIDFYYAHSGAFIYDIAVTVSDWCYDEMNLLDVECCRCMLDAYQSERKISTLEIAAWITALRAAGLRFWLSRLKDFYFPRAGELTQTKDPNAFKQVIIECLDNPSKLNSVWQ